MDALDADVLIYAAVPGHPDGRRVLDLFRKRPRRRDGLRRDRLGRAAAEILTKAVREEADTKIAAFAALLGRLDLRAVDEATAQLAVALGVGYGLKAADAVRLATAVGAGAGRFLTNNRRDFPQTINEIAVTYPTDLPESVE